MEIYLHQNISLKISVKLYLLKWNLFIAAMKMKNRDSNGLRSTWIFLSFSVIYPRRDNFLSSGKRNCCKIHAEYFYEIVENWDEIKYVLSLQQSGWTLTRQFIYPTIHIMKLNKQHPSCMWPEVTGWMKSFHDFVHSRHLQSLLRRNRLQHHHQRIQVSSPHFVRPLCNQSIEMLGLWNISRLGEAAYIISSTAMTSDCKVQFLYH